MKKGFTMIELIFVIVIIGILAAVAVPKLTSVKDDAEATKMLSNLKTFVDKELVTYHAANDKFPKITAEADIKKFTDVKEVKMKTATSTAGVTVYNFKAGADDACIEITTNDSAGTVTIKPNKSTANKGCQVALVAAVKNEYLNGTVDKDGKVTNIENETVVSAVGGDSGRYDTSGAFGTTTQP